MCTYENFRRITYHDKSGYYGDAIFIPVCSNCGRFVKAYAFISVTEFGLKDKPNAHCSKCGEVKMPFEGFL